MVSKEQFDELVAKFSKEEKGYVVVETPEEDARIIEQLLDLPKGSADKSIVKVVEASKDCASCGRHYSFLDQVSTGLSAHSKQFMKDLFIGRHGYVFNNPTQPQVHNCYKCGKTAPDFYSLYIMMGYGCSP
jgi:hypothetical protein